MLSRKASSCPPPLSWGNGRLCLCSPPCWTAQTLTCVPVLCNAPPHSWNNSLGSQFTGLANTCPARNGWFCTQCPGRTRHATPSSQLILVPLHYPDSVFSLVKSADMLSGHFLNCWLDASASVHISGPNFTRLSGVQCHRRLNRSILSIQRFLQRIIFTHIY